MSDGSNCLSALPEVRGQDNSGSSHSTGLLAGVAVAGIVVVMVVLVAGVLCVFKVRVRSKSVNLPGSNNIGFGKHDKTVQCKRKM